MIQARAVPIALAALLGGLVASSANAAPGCKQNGDCEVDVRIDNCQSAAGIVAIPDDLPVPDQKRQKKITWRIVTKGYSFQDQGIEIKSPPQGEFELDAHGGDKFTLRNRHSKAGRYHYWIRVRKDGGANCTDKDPVITNR